MKKSLLIAAMLLPLLLTFCKHESTVRKVDLSGPWRFQKGDDLSWAAPAYDDRKWDTLLPTTWWEEQGYKRLDGFGWYRVKFIIPSDLKVNAFRKDSLQFLLGKIDDCDQVFLNGVLIGENGVTIRGNEKPGNDFITVRDKWDLDRRYVLSADDPRILWDQENTLAVRVFDQGGYGGMFSKPFEIAMVDLKDYVKFDFSFSAFTFEGDTAVSRKFTLQNNYGKSDFRGVLEWKVVSYENGNTLYKKDSVIVLDKNGKSQYRMRFLTDPQKPCYAELTFTETTTGHRVTETLEVPYIWTPAPTPQPRINGARVFGVRVWSPFRFKVPATGQPPLKYSAEGLPQGLKIDSLSGQITGMLSKKGEYPVKLKVTNVLGKAEGGLKIVCGDLISLTPPMGWNSWNCWGLSVSDEKVRISAGLIKSMGLIDHGWTYVNIDDGWEDKHDKDGNILTNSKFPDMKALCSYIHSLGLKAGIYSSPGTKTCGGYEGSFTFEEKDAKAYADWGIDYLKYDWCSYGRIAPDPTLDQMKYPYKVMRHALRQVPRDIHYSLCQYGMGNVWEWGAEVDGNSWRTTGDIEDTWESLSAIGFSQNKCSPYAQPGRWNDPDMLVVGWVGWGPALHYTRLTPSEQYTHITLWCLLSAPLLIGCDLSQLDLFTLSLLTNDEVLAIDQDPLGRQATQAKANEKYQIWIKDLEGGGKAIGLFNLTDQPLNVPVDLKELGLTGRLNLRDLWKQKDLGQAENHFEMNVLPHGAVLVTVIR
ncbi:MAG TPA: putative Ig domain-containing protein [Bacteroidales bacterium]|nr:putative Ig domain-containing protein [Bacteroidales bacterium]